MENDVFVGLAREDFVLKKICCDERSFCTFTSDVMHHTEASSIGAFDKTAKVPRSISLAKRDDSYTILKLVTPMGLHWDFIGYKTKITAKKSAATNLIGQEFDRLFFF